MISPRINIEEAKKVIGKKFDVLNMKADSILDKFENMEIDTGNDKSVRKEVYPLPPYNFVYAITKFLKSGTLEDYKKYLSFGEAKTVVNVVNHIDSLIDENVNDKLRLLELEKDLIPLIESTDNRIFYRPLFFNTVFINNQFNVEGKGHCFVVKGILVHDIKDNYFIVVFAINKDNMKIRIEFFYLISKRDDKELDYIRNIVLNIVDLVEANDEDLDTVIIKSSKEQNIKRVEKGNIPYPDKVYIRVKDKFKKYVKEFNEDVDREKRKVGHKFMVRGHWRTYEAERYRPETRAKPIWIKPFYKGHGILVKKQYKLME